MLTRKIVKSETIEVLIPANSTGINYLIGSQYTNLEKGKITGVEVFRVGDVTKTPKGVNVVNDAVLKQSFLELYENGSLKANRIPMARLAYGSAFGQDLGFTPFKIDLSNSKIVLGSTSGLAVSDEAFLLTFYYE